MGADLGQRFEVFYEDHFETVVRAVYLSYGTSQDAFDTTQEAFARTWAHWDRVAESERPILYTLKVARNLSKNSLRQTLRLRRSLALLGRNVEASQTGDGPELRLTVESALRDLPPRQRWAIVLCDLLELPSHEAALVMGSSPSTVRVHLARARERLRRSLSDTVSAKEPRSSSQLGGEANV